MEIITGKIAGAQKVVIYGPEGIGKSTFASKFPNPIFIDVEGSTKHMDVARTPKPISWTMLMEQIQYFKQNPDKCQTLIIDTADWAEILCMEHICAKSQKKGIEDFGYGKGYTYLVEEFGRFLNLLEDVIDTGTNVVVTAHALMRKFEQPSELGAYDRWELKLQKKTAPLLKEWADTVLFANYKIYVVNVDGQGAQKGKNKAQGGKRVMYTSHHPCWDAKNRWDLEPELEFEYKSISQHIPAEKNKPEQQTQKEIQEIKTETKTKNITDQQEIKTTEVQTDTGTKSPDTNIEKTDTDADADNENDDDFFGIDSTIPENLAQLMRTNKVSVPEIQEVVFQKGYYPEDTHIKNYDPGFIQGVLVGAWTQVFKEIQTNRELLDIPF